MRVSLIGDYGCEELARAFRELGWTVNQHPENMVIRDGLGREKVPLNLVKASLYILVGDLGDARKLPKWAHPLVTWSIDPHYSRCFEWGLQNARLADLSFVTEKPAVTEYTRRGAQAQWLPLACEDQPKPFVATEIYDLTFVGSLGPGTAEDRNRICALVKKRCINCYIGTAWGDQLTQVYGQSKIILNSSWMTTYRNIPPRVFHVLHAQKCLLTDECAGLLDLFEEDKHLVVYRSDEDLVAKATELLADPDKRNRIAEAGHVKAMQDHTFKNRAKKILKESMKHGLIPHV